jgi:hypothetical protein
VKKKGISGIRKMKIKKEGVEGTGFISNGSISIIKDWQAQHPIMTIEKNKAKKLYQQQ